MSMQVFSLSKLGQSIKTALIGIKNAFRSEQTFRIQFIWGILAIILSFIFPLDLTQKAIVISMVGAVLGFELLNSQIEKILDIIQPNNDIRVKIVKDFSAAAVLIISISAFLVGLIIFLPYFLALF